jgi:hypothetical protein
LLNASHFNFVILDQPVANPVLSEIGSANINQQVKFSSLITRPLVGLEQLRTMNTNLGVLIDDFKHPSVTCSRCSGVIDIANANVIPLIMRDYMPQCICDTAHFNSGWKTAKVPLHDDRTFAGLVEQMIAKSDKECGE